MAINIERILRTVEGTLLAVIALNAFAGGYYGMAGAKSVPREWLAGSPFHDYFMPSLFLFVVVGGLSLVAAICVFTGTKHGRLLAMIAGTVMIAWIAIQVSIIGYVSWMQPAVFIIGVVVLLLGSQMNRSHVV